MNIKIISKNKRAAYDYHLEEKLEVGIVLKGTEIKVLAQGQASLAEAYIAIDKGGEAWIYNMNIPHYKFGNIHNHQPTRVRKLLMHKKEITHYAQQVSAGNYSIVPCALYFRKGKAKLEIALGRGKKKYDKRQAQAKKDIQKRLRRREYD